MFPQTTLIPTVLALSQFFIDHFPDIWWYPNWYLGNPYYFLIGPVVPGLIFVFSKLFHFQPQAIYLSIIIFSHILGGLGVYTLVYALSKQRKDAVVASLVYLLLPLQWFLLVFQSGLDHIAFGLLPWSVVLLIKMLSGKKIYTTVLLILFLAFQFLISVYLLLPVILIFSIVFIVLRTKIGQFWMNATKVALIILAALSLATIWYTPQFWLVLLGSPSFGGKPLIAVMKNIFVLITHLLPIILALVFVRLRGIKLNSVTLVGLLFLSSFGTLTFFRFLSDPDFVSDWIGYLKELQFGGSLVIAGLIHKAKHPWYLVLVYAGIVILSWYGLIHLWQKNSDETYKTQILDLLTSIDLEKDRIFLSGSTVFWLDSKLPVMHLRGGNDSVAINPLLNHAAYQIREGKDSKLIRLWSRAFGLSYLLVNDQTSKEYYRDFQYLGRFSDFKEKAFEQGNHLISIGNSSIAREASKGIFNSPKPVDGKDIEAISEYTNSLKEKVNIHFDKPNRIRLTGGFKKGQVISLAITYHSFWEGGDGVLVKQDSFENLAIVSLVEQKDIILNFNPSKFLFLISLTMFLMFLYTLFNLQWIFDSVSKATDLTRYGFKDDE